MWNPDPTKPATLKNLFLEMGWDWTFRFHNGTSWFYMEFYKNHLSGECTTNSFARSFYLSFCRHQLKGGRTRRSSLIAARRYSTLPHTACGGVKNLSLMEFAQMQRVTRGFLVLHLCEPATHKTRISKCMCISTGSTAGGSENFNDEKRKTANQWRTFWLTAWTQ